MSTRYVYYTSNGTVQGWRTEYFVEEGEDPMEVLERITPIWYRTTTERHDIEYEPYADWVFHGSEQRGDWVRTRYAYLQKRSKARPMPATNPGPLKPAPVLPVEVHHVTAFDPELAMELVRALSRGV